MSDHDTTSQGPPLTNGGIADLFINNPVAPKSSDSAPVDSWIDPTPKTWIDEPVTNGHKHDDETNNLTNGSSFLDVPATHEDTSEHSVKGDSHKDDKLHDEIQKAMADVINDMQSTSTASADNTRLSRQSHASHHAPADETNHSEPILDPMSNGTHEAPVRSASEPLLNDHQTNGEPTTTLPIRKDESSSDIDDHYGISAAPTNNMNNSDDPFDGVNEQPKAQDTTEQTTHDDFFDTKTATTEDEQRAASPAKSNILDETTRFTTTSPKSSNSRAPSSTSKRSVRATPDDLSTHDDEKKTSKSLDDAGTETDRENQEVTEVARRPSVARSPVNRPGSPTPDDSSPSVTPQDNEQVTSSAVTHEEPHATDGFPRMSPVVNQSESPSPVLMQSRSPTGEHPVETTQSASRRESTTAPDQKPPSRLSMGSKGNVESKNLSPTASRRSSDHVQDPIHPAETRSSPSPPSSPKIHQMITANPLIDEQSRRSSTAKAASPTPSQGSRGKTLDTEPVHAPASRRESQANGTDAKPSSSEPTHADEPLLQATGSRRTSQAHDTADAETHHEEAPSNRRSSKLSQGPSDEHITVNIEPPTPQVDETHSQGHLGHSRQPSTASVKQVSSKRSSVTSEKIPPTAHDGTIDEPKLGSKRNSVATEQKPSSRRESFQEASSASSKRTSPTQAISTGDARKSVTHETKTPSPPPATAHHESPSTSRRSSGVVESKKVSRPASVTEDHHDDIRRSSFQQEVSPGSKRVSTVSDHLGFNPNALDSKAASRRESTNEAPDVANKRPSHVSEHAPSAQHHESGSRRESTHEESRVASKRGSNASDHPVLHQHDHTDGEYKAPSRRDSTNEDSHAPSKRASTIVDQAPSSRRSSTKDEPKVPTSKRQSTAMPSNAGSRRSSHGENQHNISQHHIVASESHPPSKRHSMASEHHQSSMEDDSAPVQHDSNRRTSAASDKAPVASKRSSLAVENEQGAASRRESHRSDKPAIFNRQSSSDDQERKPPSRVPSRKHSFVEPAPPGSRRESQHQHVSSRSGTDHDEKRSPSPHHLAVVVDSLPSQQASRRTSEVKGHDETSKGSSRSRNESFKSGNDLQQARPVSGHVSGGSHYSSSNGHIINHRNGHTGSDSSPKELQSSDMESPSRRVSQSKHNRTASHDQRSQSPSTDHGNEKQPSAQKRASGQTSKRGSHMNTEETIVIPLALETPTSRAKSFRSATESESEQGNSSRLPPVNGMGHRTEASNKGALPASHNRKDYKPLRGSNASSPSEHAGKEHWTTNVIVPSLDFSADDISTSRVDHERPQSPSVEKMAERNKPPSPVGASTAKTRDSTDIHRKKGEKRALRRDNSAEDSATHIRIVDDKSLDSASEHDGEFERRKGRRYKPKQREAQTNTDDAYTFYAHQNQSGSYRDQRYQQDDRDYTPQKPLKATKPMPEHLHGVRRRIASRDQPVSTPETIGDAETPVVRRVVKHGKESTQNKDPVNVNVTVVVKKFAGSGRDRSSNVTTEAYVDEGSETSSPVSTRRRQAAVTHHEVVSAPSKTEDQSAREPPTETAEETTHEPTEDQTALGEESEKYFETVTPPPYATEEQVVHEDEDQIEESMIRPSSTDHAHSATSKKVTHFEDRAIQSDTEQAKPETQKRRLRPKRISRTCQTYEHIFRRMEREQQQELRAVTDSDKNIQTRKSQLRPRKKSPKKDQSMYLSTDSFRVEDLLPSHFHQSRRNVSKSSVVARSLSPQGGKLLILRPTLPFHHTDAVNVHRVCLQYAIDLIPSDNPSNGSPPTHRIKSSVHQQSDSLNSLPMIRSASPGTASASTKSRKKEKSASHKSEEHHHHHHRKHSGAH